VRLAGFLVCLAGTVFFAAYAVQRGQDANWDLQHYHDYAGYALLHWRYDRDIAAAGVQTFFNPAPYVISYVLRHHAGPVAGALALGAVQSASLWVVWLLTGAVLPPRALWVRVLAVAMAATGGLTLSEVGTSFCDLLLSAPLLAALLLVLPADRAGRPVLRLSVAGVLAGVVTGLKLTNGVFAIGLAAAILVRPARGLLARLAGFGAGGLAGLLVGTGWWCLYLWRRFGNPVFPLLNNLFHSPDAIAWDFVDPTYQPHSLWDAASVPWRWAIGGHPGAEVAFRDGRVALAWLLIAAAVAARRWSGGTALLRAILFFAVSFVLWSALFGIARYAIPLEILAGLLIVALAYHRLAPGRASGFGLVVLSAAVILWTSPGEWGHRPWKGAFRGPHWPAPLANPAIFVLPEHRFSYLAAYAPAASLFYGLQPSLLPPGGHFLDAMRDTILHPGAGGAWVLTHDAPLPAEGLAELASLGVSPSADCVDVAALGWDGIKACRLVAPP
jgi:hypothetical protein